MGVDPYSSRSGYDALATAFPGTDSIDDANSWNETFSSLSADIHYPTTLPPPVGITAVKYAPAPETVQSTMYRPADTRLCYHPPRARRC